MQFFSVFRIKIFLPKFLDTISFIFFPFVFRILKGKSSTDFISVNLISGRDHQFPAGTGLLIYLGSVHLNPKYYPEPNKFNPDNFTPEAEARRPKCAFIPMGGGGRMCPGECTCRYCLIFLTKPLYFSIIMFSNGRGMANYGWTVSEFLFSKCKFQQCRYSKHFKWLRFRIRTWFKLFLEIHSVAYAQAEFVPIVHTPQFEDNPLLPSSRGMLKES